jgi:Mg2+-importing ATPase
MVDSTFSRARIQLRIADVGTIRMVSVTDSINDIIHHYFPPEKAQIDVTGTSVVFALGSSKLIDNLVQSLVLAIFLISLCMMWLFKSWKMVIISIIPNFIPLIVTAAIMGYCGIRLKSSTILVFNIAFGISVDNAVDIAKEVADIILLEKDLMVLDEGVVEGRSTFANMSKYLKMSVSGNFGNMFSVLIASIFLPFLPMLPVHILVQNLLNDFAQLGMPFDHVESKYIEKPKKWDLGGIKGFMVSFGLLSTVLDVLCFLVLWFVFGYNNPDMAGYFQCGWFMFGVISQTMVIHTIRTPKLPFIGDRASIQLTLSTLAVIAVTLIIGFTGLSALFDLPTMPISYMLWLAILMVVYMVFAQIMKVIYIKRHKDWY